VESSEWEMFDFFIRDDFQELRRKQEFRERHRDTHRTRWIVFSWVEKKKKGISMFAAVKVV